VETTQVAPTILQLLGLDPHALYAVRGEGTPVLAGVVSDRLPPELWIGKNCSSRTRKRRSLCIFIAVAIDLSLKKGPFAILNL
jgi:hypothetical protein